MFIYDVISFPPPHTREHRETLDMMAASSPLRVGKVKTEKGLRVAQIPIKYMVWKMLDSCEQN